MSKKILAIAGLVGIGIIGRLMPHMPNATPITAIAITAEKHVGRMWAIVIPLLAMLISDFAIGFYNWKILMSVYGSFALIGLLSIIARGYPRIFPPVLLVACASLVFFLVTNFSVWLFSPWYEKTVSGLLYCYLLGLPFLRNMLLGDVIYTFTLLKVFETSIAFQMRKQLILKNT